MRRWVFVGIFAAIGFSIATSRAAADDIPLSSISITGGTADVNSPVSVPVFLTFTVTGDALSATGFWRAGSSPAITACGSVSGCNASQAFTLSTTVANLTHNPGGEIGALWNGLEMVGSWQFTTPEVTLPIPPPGFQFGDVVGAPFTLTGSVQFFNPLDFFGGPLAAANVSGAGTAFLSLAAGPNDHYSLPRIRYEFSDTEPVPELPPGILMMAGSMVLMLSRQVRKRLWNITFAR